MYDSKFLTWRHSQQDEPDGRNLVTFDNSIINYFFLICFGCTDLLWGVVIAGHDDFSGQTTLI
jgi:hypothetical protein